MCIIGEKQEVIRPEFDPSTSIDFQGATVTSDADLLLCQQIDERCGILDSVAPGFLAEIAEILNYYSRRWAIEYCFKDCKQLLGLCKSQSETFDAVVAWVAIVMIRYLILVYILAGKQLAGPICPLFQELAREHLQLALMQSLRTRIRQLPMLSRRLFVSDSESEEFFYLPDMCLELH